MAQAKISAKQPSAAPPKKAAAKPAPVAAPASPESEHVAFELMEPPVSPAREETEAKAAATDAATEAVTAASPYGVIIEDGLPPADGQVNRTPFMDRLAPAIESAADDLLKPAGREAKDCPYLGFWLKYYRDQSAAHIERAIAKYIAPEQTDLEGLEQAILTHVRDAVKAWVEHRAVQVPGEIDWRVDDDLVKDAPGEGAVAQRMGSNGQGAPAAPGSAAAVRGQLAKGSPLDSAVRTRMERGFGASFGEVRIHTDSGAASTAKAYQARAFTVGQDVAFGAGQYRPGTTAGDLLLAHELAHTIQQRGAIAEGPAAQRYETDADQAAIGALLPDSNFDPSPKLGGGLALRRCGTGEEPAPPSVSNKEYQDTITELKSLYVRRNGVQDGTVPATEQADIDNRIRALTEKVRGWGVQLSDRQLQRAVESGENLRDKIGQPLSLGPEDMADMGYSLVSPSGELTVGRDYELSIRGPLAVDAQGLSREYGAKGWYVQKPGEPELHGLQGWTGRSHSWTLDVPGEWKFAAEIRLGGEDSGLLTQTITVVTPDKAAEDKLKTVEPATLPGYISRLDTQDLQNIHLGLENQNFGGNYISLVGSNPLMGYRNFLDVPDNVYTINPAAGVVPTRVQWLAVPADFSAYPTQEFNGRPMREIGGRRGFDLGTGNSTRWSPIYTGIVTIYCTIYDAGGFAAEVRYRQVSLSTDEVSGVNKYRKYMKEAKEELRKIQEDSAVYAPAFHIAKETGIGTELSLFIGVPTSGSGIKIIDVTPGIPRREYGGSDFQSALNDFNSGNSYPVGTIRVNVPENKLGIDAIGWKIETSGASITQRLSSGWGWASLGMAALGTLAAIIPGTQPLAPAFFFAAAGLGALSAGASLYQRSLEADPSGLGIAIDIASLAGSLLGLAGAANILRYGPRVAALTKVGQFVLYAGFTTDAIAGVFMLAQSAEEIAAILDGPGNAEAKSAAITRILAGLLLNGGMLAWGAKDMRAAGKRLEVAIGAGGASVIAHLPAAEVHMLGTLEGPALKRLAGASLEDVKAVSAVMREDPARAIALADRFGEQFVAGALARPGSLEELSQALLAGAGEAAGTRGSYGPQVAGAPRPAYLEEAPNAAGHGQSSPSGLADRILRVFTNPKSPLHIPLAEGATLRAVAPPTGGKPSYELVIPAQAVRPEMVIPVTIQSTKTRPTSVHGTETGPARMEIRSSKDSADVTKYEANIEVHENLARSDVGFAVGHELDELALIAISGVQGNEITKQKRASLMRPQAATAGGPAPLITAHDTSQARDFANFVKQSVPVAQRPANFAMPEDVIARALSMGLGGGAYLEDKLALLRRAGVDEEMLSRLRVLAIGGDLKARLPLNSPFTSGRVIGHLIYAEKGSPASPIGGLHLDSALAAYQADLVARNQPMHLLPTADSPRTAAGQTYNAYEQWEWTGGGTPGPRPTTPGRAAGATSGGWTLATDAKTTFNSLPGFLSEAQSAWDNWRAANPLASGDNVRWTSTATPGGQTIQGYVDLSGPSPVQRTVYPYRVGGLASW